MSEEKEGRKARGVKPSSLVEGKDGREREKEEGGEGGREGRGGKEGGRQRSAVFPVPCFFLNLFFS